VIGSPHFRKRGQKVLIGSGGWMFRQRSGAASAADAPTFWLDDALDRRVEIAATNPSALVLHDQLVTATVPAGITAGTLRVVEVDADGGIERAFDSGYVPGATINRLAFCPASLSGTTLTFQALGRWAAGATRTFRAYWDSTNVAAFTPQTYLDVVPIAWTGTVVSAVDTATYTLVVGGTPYSTTATGVSTTATIATALRAAINAGTEAVASGSSATVTVTPTAASQRNPAFAVTNAGTTTPANLTVAKPGYWPVKRAGPDTEATNALGGWNTGMPIDASTQQAQAAGRAAIGWSDVNAAIRLLVYKVSGDASTYGLVLGAVTTVSFDGPTITITGTLTGSTRLAATDWSGTYTATFHHKVAALDKTNGLAPLSVHKQANCVRLQLTLTCARAYTPVNDTGAGTSVINQAILSVNHALTFAGNGTTVAGEQLTNWYATDAAAPASIATSSDTAGLTIAGSMVGGAGNTNCYGVRVNSAALSLGAGQSAAIVKWWGGNLQIASTTSTQTIPQGSTITLDCWLLFHRTNSPATTGDNLTPTEARLLLRGLAVTPTATVAAAESYASASLAATMASAATKAVSGLDWFADNALAKTGLAANYAYQWNTVTSVVDVPDDDDGTYGHAHALHGLCLRYRRTRDASLIAKIERAAQYHLDIEAAAVATWGSFYNGSAPYFYAPKAMTKTASEGGLAGNYTDAGVATGPTLTVNYTTGQPRRLTSVDQMNMVVHGLYAYLYLLRNESAITANTTLRTNVRAYLDRMATFEGNYTPTNGRAARNLARKLDGLAALDANGRTNANTSTPYYGNLYDAWQRSNGDGVAIGPSANTALVAFFQSLYSGDGTLAATTRYMQGEAQNTLTGDAGRHDVTYSPATWGVLGTYPDSWGLRSAAVGNNTKYTSGRAGDDHYFSLTSGVRDSMTGRSAQRLGVLCLAALLDPTYSVPIETDGAGTVLRSVNIVTACDDMAQSLALYGRDPTTDAMRFSSTGFLGGSGPWTLDSAFTGYWMWASELWHLVHAGASYLDYYPVGNW
jgi:hypothetical protein